MGHKHWIIWVHLKDLEALSKMLCGLKMSLNATCNLFPVICINPFVCLFVCRPIHCCGKSVRYVHRLFCTRFVSNQHVFVKNLIIYSILKNNQVIHCVSDWLFVKQVSKTKTFSKLNFALQHNITCHNYNNNAS